MFSLSFVATICSVTVPFLQYWIISHVPLYVFFNLHCLIFEHDMISNLVVGVYNDFVPTNIIIINFSCFY